ncbi:MAG TPA: bifunctional UDP-N-acetylglucosamine diphosphorylase/glucosamine-1-phosphate N-acetyltransferase GlmU [Actinomycetota bacterium]|nr:bifunctional UDP-N-acetylglucosamine diphosphorylase/glucosamine-1-phosphate N-acetyltransferase GlmU [Actinomycetota bacterium]
MPSETSLAAIVLAAGFGKRFHSASTPKVLHRAAGEPLVAHALTAVGALPGLDRLIVVVGHGKEQVIGAVTARFPDAEFVTQPVPRGTGDAVAACEETLEGYDGQVVVVSGDSPLITTATLASLVDAHRRARADVTALTAVLDDPTGYGRVIRETDGTIRIVEQADASPADQQVREVSVCFWCFEREPLFQALAKVTTGNAQGEYYLPDVVPIIASTGGRIATFMAADVTEVVGVNDRRQLAEVSAHLRARKLDALMASGVTVEDPAATYVDARVEVGPDTVLRPMTFLEGTTKVGSGCTIGPSARLVDTEVGDGAEVSFAVVKSARIGPDAQVGPFTSLRPATRLEARSKAGSFVEMKASTVGEGSKVPHLSYIGDAEIGNGVNVGAGTITCNYDGEAKVKSRTKIGDGVLLGSDTMLVAPVTVGDGAITGAGAVVTKDVKPNTVVVGAPARPLRTRRPLPGSTPPDDH